MEPIKTDEKTVGEAMAEQLLAVAERIKMCTKNEQLKCARCKLRYAKCMDVVEMLARVILPPVKDGWLANDGWLTWLHSMQDSAKDALKVVKWRDKPESGTIN